MKRNLLFLMISMCLAATGCQTGAPKNPAVTLAVQAIVPTPVVRVITRTPPPTMTFTPMPTLPYDMANYQGRWQMDLTYHLYGLPVFSDIRYNGGVDLVVSEDGQISGSGVINAILRQPPCNAIVKDAIGLDFTISGKLVAVPGGGVIGDLTLVPGNPDAKQTFILACAEESRSREQTLSLLWPALAVTNQLNPQITFAPNTVITSLRNLTGPSAGRLYGTLAAEIRLNR